MILELLAVRNGFTAPSMRRRSAEAALRFDAPGGLECGEACVDLKSDLLNCGKSTAMFGAESGVGSSPTACLASCFPQAETLRQRLRQHATRSSFARGVEALLRRGGRRVHRRAS
jgi:hypothetical protein